MAKPDSDPMFETTFIKALGLTTPIIVAPMAGGPTTVNLVAASCNAGALGSLGAAYSKPKDIAEFAQKIRELTSRPFAINLFLPQPIPTITPEHLRRAIVATAEYRKELGLLVPKLEAPFEEDFDAQFSTVLEIKPRVLSFIFGTLKPEYTKEARKAGIYLNGTATSLDEALALEESGVDAITLQGIEAGGHRAIFDPHANDPEVNMFDLLTTVRKKIRRPLIAAGGIMNAHHIRQALSAGASAVQMGTAFLAVKEAGTSVPYRRQLLNSHERSTKTTRAFSGRLARGIVNRFMSEMDQKKDAVLPFPIQNKFTRDLRAASASADSSEFLSLWSGSGEGELWTGGAGELIEKLSAEVSAK